MTRLSGRGFNRETGESKGARHDRAEKSAADLLAMTEAAAIPFEPPRLTSNLHKRVDLS